jgi:hypothetical protein
MSERGKEQVIGSHTRQPISSRYNEGDMQVIK